MGAAVFSITRLRSDRIPQEAVIGLVYAVAAAVVILVVDRAPHGAEHIKEVSTGAFELDPDAPIPPQAETAAPLLQWMRDRGCDHRP